MNNLEPTLTMFRTSEVKTDSSRSYINFISPNKSTCEYDESDSPNTDVETDSPRSLLDFISSHNSTYKYDESDSPNSDVETGSPRTLFDFIRDHNSACENEDTDSPRTLLDLINAHSSQSKEDVASLCDLTSRNLNLEEKATNNPPSSLDAIYDGSSENECDTLEEYTKSFLNSNCSNIFQHRMPKLRPPFLIKNIVENDLENVDKKMSNCSISESNKAETRKIDLTAALENKLKQNSMTSRLQPSTDVKSSSFSDRLRKNSVDFLFTNISFLIHEELMYGNSTLSPLGLVACKKWNRPSLPKKYRKIEKIRPYNIAKSFKFDTPSPDDVILSSRERNNSVNES